MRTEPHYSTSEVARARNIGPDRQPHNGFVPYSTLPDSEIIDFPMMPENQYRNLPANIKDQTCHCEFPHWSRATENIVPYGTWCLECKKPHRYTTIHVMQLCEGCDTYYVPGINEQFPPRYKLCRRCDIPVRPRRKRSV